MAGSVSKALDDGLAVLLDADRGHGKRVIYRPAGGSDISCQMVIDSGLDASIEEGAMVFEENHYIGAVRIAELPITPAVGDTVIDGSRVFRVHIPPDTNYGMHRLTLRLEVR